MNRRVLSAAATAVVMLVVAGCARPTADVTGLASPPSAVSTPGTPPGPATVATDRPVENVTTRPPVDVLVAGQIHAADGGRIRLDLAELPDVVRVDAGWLVTAWDDTGATVWLTDGGALRRELLTGVDGYAVASGGGRLAYRLGDELIVADLTPAGRLREIARTGGVGPFRPYQLGRASVLMAYSTTGGELENFDTWAWANGPYVPTPVSHLIAGALPDGSGLVGMVPSTGSPCLAMFDPVSLRPTRSACVPGAQIGPWPSISPDARWMLVRLAPGEPGSKAGGNPIGLVDLATVFAAPTVAASWPEDPRLAVDTQACVWTDVATVLCGADRGLVRFRADRPGPAEYIQLVQRGSDRSVPVEPVVDLRR